MTCAWVGVSNCHPFLSATTASCGSLASRTSITQAHKPSITTNGRSWEIPSRRLQRQKRANPSSHKQVAVPDQAGANSTALGSSEVAPTPAPPPRLPTQQNRPCHQTSNGIIGYERTAPGPYEQGKKRKTTEVNGGHLERIGPSKLAAHRLGKVLLLQIGEVRFVVCKKVHDDAAAVKSAQVRLPQGLAL